MAGAIAPERRTAARKGERLLALLALPAVLFVILVFIAPVARFLVLAGDNSDLSQGLARTMAALSATADNRPDEAVYAALVADLAAARATRHDALIAQSLNQRQVGTRFLVLKTAQAAARGDFAPPYAQSVPAAQPGWTDPVLWDTLAAASGPITDFHLLASLDLRRSADDAVAAAPPEESILRPILLRTIWISLVVTVICAVLSLPLAQAIVSAPPTLGRVIFALVLFPLWSSLLVRTVIWIIVLQRNGPVNATLVTLGLTDAPLTLIYTRLSLYLAMVQVLLPLMVLSVASVMKRVPGTYMKAALSLGAPWFTAWRTVQLPLILPGVLSGAAIVFVFAIGYYVTPVLVGGQGDQMVSSMIAFYTNQTLNWGLAAALSIQVLLLVAAVAVAAAGARFLMSRRLV